MAVSEIKKIDRFNYMMLSRLQMDCEYYLGYGRKYAKVLWANDEQKHIDEMKRLYYDMPYHQRPQWLSETKLKYYAKKMNVNF